MSVAERHFRRQGMKCCWKNTNEAGLPGQHDLRLTSNSRELGLGVQTCLQQKPKRRKGLAKKHVCFPTRPPERKGWLGAIEGRQGLSYTYLRYSLGECRRVCLEEDEDYMVHIRGCVKVCGH